MHSQGQGCIWDSVVPFQVEHQRVALVGRERQSLVTHQEHIFMCIHYIGPPIVLGKGQIWKIFVRFAAGPREHGLQLRLSRATAEVIRK